MFEKRHEESFDSRVLDEIYIEANDGNVKFSLVKKRNNEAAEIARVNNIDEMLGDDLMHCLCDEFLCYCHDDNWDGKWNSIDDGEYVVGFDEFCGTLDQTVFDGHYLELYAGDATSVSDVSMLTGFPRFWELFGFLLPRRARQRFFTPAHHALLEDYLATREKRFRTPWARRWLNFCFTFHTFLLVLQCCKEIVCGGALAMLLYLTPPAVKEWCREFWFDLFR